MRPFQSIRSLLVHPKDKHRPQDICECVYKIPCKNCNKTYICETGRAFGVRLQEHQQEVSQRDVRAYTRSTSRSVAGEQNKSAVTDHAISLNHVIDWDQAKVIDREGNRGDRWIKEAIHIRKEQDKSMNRDEGSYQLSDIYDILFALTERRTAIRQTVPMKAPAEAETSTLINKKVALLNEFHFELVPAFVSDRKATVLQDTFSQLLRVFDRHSL